MRPRSTPPLWFQIAVAAAIAIALRWTLPAHGGGDAAPGQFPEPHYAFLQFLIFLGSLIWKGLEVAGKVTLAALKWVVVNLSLVVTKLGNGLKSLGGDLLKALKRSWDFLK